MKLIHVLLATAFMTVAISVLGAANHAHASIAGYAGGFLVGTTCGAFLVWAYTKFHYWLLNHLPDQMPLWVELIISPVMLLPVIVSVPLGLGLGFLLFGHY